MDKLTTLWITVRLCAVIHNYSMEALKIMEEAVIGLVKFAETSFPVAVAAYLLVRMETRLSALTDAITGLKHSLDPID